MQVKRIVANIAAEDISEAQGASTKTSSVSTS